MRPDTRIRACFTELGAARRTALVVYLTAGDPDLATSRKAVLAAAQAGADVIELGVPFSDPFADGPVLQEAAARALRAGATLSKTLELVRSLRTECSVPLLLFGYYNPVLTYGERRLATDAAKAGADGLLVVDLPPEEAGGLRAACDEVSLDLVPLIAPTSSPDRVQAALRVASGFVYFVSMTGVTGARLADPDIIVRSVDAVRPLIDLPLAVGFGVATADQAARVARCADAVVVGSAAVRAAQGGLETLSAFVASLRGAIP